tara:strand:+ start:276 stop:908 length:633 start_codon:yes stop_codon:yes gene_type:complete
MKYVLGLSFLYKKFKRDAIIRIFSNNLLIEEIILEKNVDLITKKKPDCRLPHTFPNKLHVIEVNGDVLGDSIDIEYVNNDNNYTNGFMTKFSYIEFYGVLLFPKKLLQRNVHDRIFKEDGTYSIHPEKKNIWPLAVDNVKIVNNGVAMNETTMYRLQLGGKIAIKMPLIKKHKTIMFGDKHKARGKFLIWEEAQNLIYHFGLLNTYNENQ